MQLSGNNVIIPPRKREIYSTPKSDLGPAASTPYEASSTLSTLSEALKENFLFQTREPPQLPAPEPSSSAQELAESASLSRPPSRPRAGRPTGCPQRLAIRAGGEVRSSPRSFSDGHREWKQQTRSHSRAQCNSSPHQKEPTQLRPRPGVGRGLGLDFNRGRRSGRGQGSTPLLRPLEGRRSPRRSRGRTSGKRRPAAGPGARVPRGRRDRARDPATRRTLRPAARAAAAARPARPPHFPFPRLPRSLASLLLFPGSAILIPAPAQPASCAPAPHLGDGLAVAGHCLLDEAENFHVAVSAGHHDTGPSETHGHFHAAGAGAGPRPRPSLTAAEQPWPEAGGWRGRAADGRVAAGRGQATPGSRWLTCPAWLPHLRGSPRLSPRRPRLWPPVRRLARSAAAAAAARAWRRSGSGSGSGSRSGAGEGMAVLGEREGLRKGGAEPRHTTPRTCGGRRRRPGRGGARPGTPAARAGLRVPVPLASLAQGRLRSAHPNPPPRRPLRTPASLRSNLPPFLCRF